MVRRLRGPVTSKKTGGGTDLDTWTLTLILLLYTSLSKGLLKCVG